MKVSPKDKDTSHWQAGIARICITPKVPLILMGYITKARHRPATGVLDDLYTSAVALEDCEGNISLIIGVDTAVLRKPLAEKIRTAIATKCSLPKDRILLNSSHTHSAPALAQDDTLDRIPMGEDLKNECERYTETLNEKMIMAAQKAIEDLKPARLFKGAGKTSIMVNRRCFDDKGAYLGMGPNVSGSIDPVVPVLRINTPEGDLRGIIFGCACHNVTLDQYNLLVSADYAGFARKNLETKYPDAKVIFLTGCGADANTHPRGGDQQTELVKTHGATMAADVERVLSHPMQLVHGPLKTAMFQLNLPLQTNLTEKELQEMINDGNAQAFNAQNILNLKRRNASLPVSYPAPFSVWRFGDSFELIGISGEVVHGYALHLREVIGPETWVTGYTHEVFGYLPTAQIVSEGGYETRGLLSPFAGFFSAEVEDTIISGVQRVINSLKKDDRGAMNIGADTNTF